MAYIFMHDTLLAVACTLNIKFLNFRFLLFFAQKKFVLEKTIKSFVLNWSQSLIENRKH